MIGTLRDNFLATVSNWSDHDAIIESGRRYSYGELNARANQLAHFLADLGVAKGDGVGLYLNNCAEFAIGFVACQKLGAVSSCLNYRLSAGPIGHAVAQEKLKVLIFNDTRTETAAEIMEDADACRFVCAGGPGPKGARAFDECDGFPDTEPLAVSIVESDLCNVIHTSGTTGRPKGAAFTHESQIITAIQYCLEMGLDRGHVGMSLAPVVIGAATNFFAAYLFLGAPQVMVGEYEAGRALRMIAEHGVTEAFAVPTQMYQMAEAIGGLSELDVSSLRLLRTGGSAMSGALLHRVRDRLGCDVLNTYGTTESCTAITGCHTGLDPEDKWESIGKASYFQEVRVVEIGDEGAVAPDATIAIPGEGQLINRGAQCVDEYHCTPDETLQARDGWQYARDVVRIDRDGYLYPIDRIDNLIISGGENIYPQEIEFFLSKHPQIVDVAVCGVPDEKWGQTIKALIVRASDELTEAAVDSYCLESGELPRYKRPRVIEFVDAVPRNILGKIDRRKIG